MKRRTGNVIICVLLTALCSCAGQGSGLQRQAPAITEERLKAALRTAFADNETLKIAASFLGEVDSVGPVFIDGTNARAPFKLKGASGLLHECEARLSLSQDARWYLVFVDVPDIRNSSVRCNYLIE